MKFFLDENFPKTAAKLLIKKAGRKHAGRER
jgi:hypothetical protein